jgi:hypothetical protein
MDRCGRTAHEPNVLGSHPYRIARSALAQAPPQTDEVYNLAPTYTPPKTINITAQNAERTAALFRDRALSRQPSSRCRKCVRSLCEPLSLCDAAQCGRFFWPAIANLAHLHRISRCKYHRSPVALFRPTLDIKQFFYSDTRYCQELWIGGAWLGGFLPIFLVFTAFDLNTINERNTGTHQG